MFAGIESLIETKKVLIIDKEADFCKLMDFYLSKKNCKVYIADTLKDAFVKIEEQRPELIIADRDVHHNIESSINEKVDSINGYYPEINFIRATRKQPEGAVQYTLKKDYHKKNYKKKNYNKRPQSFWEKVVEYIKNLLK